VSGWHYDEPTQQPGWEEGDDVVYILRRLVVADVEAEKRRWRATAAHRRRRGVAQESYFTNPLRPQELTIIFDGLDYDQLHAAMHPAVLDETSDGAESLEVVAASSVQPLPAAATAQAELEAAIAAVGAIQDQLQRRLATLQSAAQTPRA
jgi:hypothetical protein